MSVSHGKPMFSRSVYVLAATIWMVALSGTGVAAWQRFLNNRPIITFRNSPRAQNSPPVNTVQNSPRVIHPIARPRAVCAIQDLMSCWFTCYKLRCPYYPQARCTGMRSGCVCRPVWVLGGREVDCSRPPVTAGLIGPQNSRFFNPNMAIRISSRRRLPCRIRMRFRDYDDDGGYRCKWSFNRRSRFGPRRPLISRNIGTAPIISDSPATIVRPKPGSVGPLSQPDTPAIVGAPTGPQQPMVPSGPQSPAGPVGPPPSGPVGAPPSGPMGPPSGPMGPPPSGPVGPPPSSGLMGPPAPSGGLPDVPAAVMGANVSRGVDPQILEILQNEVCAPKYGVADCTENPCFGQSCGRSDAVCRPSRCGTCHAKWFVGNQEIDCTPDCPPAVRKVRCLFDPCSRFSCPAFPSAVCRVNRCGSCRAEWRVAGIPVKCAIEKQDCPPGQTRTCPKCWMTRCPSDLSARCRVTGCTDHCGMEFYKVVNKSVEIVNCKIAGMFQSRRG